MKTRFFIVFVLIFSFYQLLPGQVYINEFLTSNVATNYDPDNTGFVDWIELYNAGNSTLNIGGYFLSDDSLNAQKWQIPAGISIPGHGYVLFWADGLDTGSHTNFKLSKSGEYVGLFSPSGTLLDGRSYPPQETDISFGRKPEDLSQWGYFFYPTPGLSNDTPFYTDTQRTVAPSFSLPGGLYSSPQTVSLSSPSADAEIHYTLDGSVPRLSSPLYSAPLTLDTTSIVRAGCFEEGFMPGPVVTQTYFIGETQHLPVISIVTENKNLFGDTIGIYCVGTNGIEGYGGIVANYWHRDWERPANIELYETDGSQVINQVGGIAINGQRRNMAQKSLRIFARKKYGTPSFHYPVFENLDIDDFHSLVLRNGGIPDFANSLIRDNLVQELATDRMDIDAQASRMSVVYLNGKYWGIYSIKEKQNESYLAAHHKIDPANIDLLENQNAGVIEGNNASYLEMMEILRNNNPGELYDYINQHIEISEYLDYLTTEIYTGNYDWPMINIKFWREKSERSKWRWLLYDTDDCFGLWGDYQYNSIHHALDTEGSGWPNPPQSTEFARLILSNEKLRNEFVQVFAAHAATTFAPETVKTKTDEMKAELQDEMPRHIARWKDFDSPDGTCIQSMAAWDTTFEEIKNYADLRWSAIRQHIIDEFNLAGYVYLTTSSEHGKIFVHHVPLEEGTHTNAFFKDVPMQLTAVPDLGYRFVKWEGLSGETSPTIEITPATSAGLTAIFETDDRSVLPTSITQQDTLYYALSPYIGYDDMTIEAGASLYIEAGVEIYMPEEKSIYVHGNLLVDGTEQLPVKMLANTEIASRNWGGLYFENTPATQILHHLIMRNTTHGLEPWQKAALAAYGSRIVCDHIDIADCWQPVHAEYGNFFIRDSRLYCYYTGDQINVQYADSAVVKNCDIGGSIAPDTDGVDFDGISYGLIQGNRIYGFNGFNCDGIDIGEGSTQIHIEKNKIYNCTDKGISVGQGSHVFVENNFIYRCNMGVGIKDSSSYALINKDTFYANDFGVACFEKNYHAGGGSADITNTIIAGSLLNPVFKDDLSSINITYSCSDTYPLDGDNNMVANPLFQDTLLMNFALSGDSPCIDAGDPGSPLDEDGSITDMGAILDYYSNPDTNIVINEINYHSGPLYNSGDWVELYNKSNHSVDLSAWTFSDSDKEHTYLIPDGLQLGPEQYLVLCNNHEQLTSVYSYPVNYRGDIGFGFSNSGEMLRLYDSRMNLCDLVEYDDHSPWPEEADGGGKTLELINPYYDNNLAESWKADKDLGSPGRSNNENSSVDNYPGQTFVLYPNPTHSYFKINKILNTELRIYSLQGVLLMEKNDPSNSLVDVSGLPPGLYFVIFNYGGEQYTLKLVIQ